MILKLEDNNKELRDLLGGRNRCRSRERMLEILDEAD
jgi:signal transduction histidine kinase